LVGVRAGAGEHFACPGCGQPIVMMTGNGPGIPFTPRFRENAD
jgi:hypothetical protein